MVPGPNHLDLGDTIPPVAYVSTVSSVLDIISDAREDYLTQMVRKTKFMTIFLKVFMVHCTMYNVYCELYKVHILYSVY